MLKKYLLRVEYKCRPTQTEWAIFPTDTAGTDDASQAQFWFKSLMTDSSVTDARILWDGTEVDKFSRELDDSVRHKQEEELDRTWHKFDVVKKHWILQRSGVIS